LPHLLKPAGTTTAIPALAQVEPDGSFEVNRIRPGSYDLAAVWSNSEGFKVATRTVTVGNSDVVGIILETHPGVDFTITAHLPTL
jgi:hypothetical protein